MLKTMTVRTAIAAILAGLALSANAIADSSQPVEIPAGDLRQALLQVSEQFGADLVYSPEQVQGLKTRGAYGQLTTEQAVTKLLEGTQLELRTDPSGAMLIALPAASKDSAPSQKKTELEEIIVTGTNIKGAHVSSPLVTITHEEMRLSGHNDLGAVIRALPQNFSGGQNPGVATFGANLNNDRNGNSTGSSTLNLRGLGPDATLTLLNGMRLPYDGRIQATDVASIPVAAIERMEVLLDGASAVYGSDAVGGVANIILKRDYEGAELTARVGVATDGGYEQTQYTAIAGANWGTGGFLVTGDVSRNTSVLARQRDYLSYLPNPGRYIIYPRSDRQGGLFSAHQRLGGIAELTVDGFYSEQTTSTFAQSSVVFANETATTIWGAAPALHVELPGEWSLRARAFTGRNESDIRSYFYSATTGALTTFSRACFCNKAEAAGVETEGPIFELPGGEARLAVGGGYRSNEFEQISFTPGTSEAGADHSRYAYGELNLPLISDRQAIPFVNRLSVNGAVRYEDYKSFGEATTPRIGTVWSLTPRFDIRANWGRSFKVPALWDLYSPTFLTLYSSSVFPAPGAPNGSTVLYTSGGNPELGPERAENISAGFAARPAFLPNLDLEFNWFHIDYTDRIVAPIRPRTQAFTNPIFSEFITLDPSVGQQSAVVAAADVFSTNPAGLTYDPANVHALVFNQNFNALTQRVRGIDLSVRYAADAFRGRLTVGINGSWITDSTRQTTELSPEQRTAGVNYFPAKFKGRLGGAWARGGLILSANVNHVSGVKDINVTPGRQRASMTTLDLVIDYQMDSGFLGGLGLNVAINNAFDQAPPFLQPLQAFDVNYDSTNYSALGRVVSLTIRKKL